MVQRSAVVQGMLDLFEAPNYLEIGVDQGETFHALEAAFKIAVDPAFKFPLPPNTDAVQYFPMTSDEFFASRLEPDRIFDVAYLDGLHTFEQTLRDLLNAALRLGPDGVIVIDDVLPTSYHAAMPSLDQAFQVRDQLALSNPALVGDNTWMGDVYKLAFFVQTFMQQFSYATVQENHGQLVLWRSARPAVSLRPRSMADVAGLGFADTVLQREVFQIRPFAAILDDIRNG